MLKHGWVVGVFWCAACVADWTPKMGLEDGSAMDSDSGTNGPSGQGHVDDADDDDADDNPQSEEAGTSPLDGGTPSGDAETASDGDSGKPPEQDAGAPECVSGDQSACTEDGEGRHIAGLTTEVGLCQFGRRTCNDVGRWGPCVGAVGPATRECDSSEDHDCDGYADDDVTRPDASCECWNGDERACTSETGGNCSGVQRCENHHFTSCDAPASCPCTGSETRPCSGGSANCPGGIQTCDGQLWGTCEGAPAACDCDDGETRACNGGMNNCPGGTQTCTQGAWGSCTGAPDYCECSSGDTRDCSEIAGAPLCGTATCDDEQRWDVSSCAAANACGGCGTLAHNVGSACDGTDDDLCEDASWECDGAGGLVCDDAVGGSAQNEICDGADNDCDGTADNAAGMQCALGSTEPCQYTQGTCQANGTRSCNGLCQWTAECNVPGETSCNLVDDDCDGHVDEGLLGISAAIPLRAFTGSVRSIHVAASPANSAANGGFLVLYESQASGSSTKNLHALRVDSSGSVVGTQLELGQSGGVAGVVWSSDEWVVAYLSPRDLSAAVYVELRTRTIDPATGTVTNGPTLAGPSPSILNVYNPQLTGGSIPVVAWAEQTNDGNSLRIAALGATVQDTTLVQATREEPRLYVGNLRTTVIEDGSEWGVWYVHNTGSGASSTSELRYLAVDASLNVTQSESLSSDTVVAMSGLVYDPRSDRLVGTVSTTSMQRLSHEVDGSDINTANVQLETLVADGSGVSGIRGWGQWNRYDENDSSFESIPYTGTGGFSQGVNPAVAAIPGAAERRFVVAGASDGVLRLFFLGCE